MYWIWPSRFYNQRFWLQKEAILDALKLATAVELALKTFRAFPGAQSVARGVVFLVLVITLTMVWAVSGPELDFDTLAGKLQPRIVNGTVWVFTVIAMLILWYRLPVDAFHKAILTGFVPYLLVFTAALQLFTSYGWDLSVSMINRYLYPLAYIVLLSYWTWSAWQPVRAPVRPRRSANDAPGLVQSA
jgi:hypothetical protein